mgnify:CR=1 FL=1
MGARRWMPVMLLGAGLALASGNVIGAQRKAPRPVTPAERADCLQKHEALTGRLVAAGLPAREDPIIHIGETPVVQAYPADADGVRGETVGVDSDFLGTSFVRNSGDLVGVLNRALANCRALEKDKRTRFAFDLTVERADALARTYLTAIQGTAPEGPGGFDEGRFVSLAGTAEREGGISADETIHAAWPRMHEGFPFREDRTSVTLSAVNGELLSYGKGWYSLPPASVEVQVQADEAVRVAMETVSEEFTRMATFDPDQEIDVTDGEGRVFGSRQAYERELARRRRLLEEAAAGWEPYVGVEPTMEAPPELMLVNPNIAYTEAYHDDLVDRRPWVRQTRLAWVVRLQCARRDAPDDHHRALPMEVWIDAAEGKVIGGECPY